MPKRYKIWDKRESINTPSGKQFTAEEWLERYPWARAKNAKMIITAGNFEDGDINGGCALNFKQTVNTYIARGMEITDNMTDDEILDAMEALENAPATTADDTPTAEERIAAALEYQNLMNLEDAAGETEVTA